MGRLFPSPSMATGRPRRSSALPQAREQGRPIAGLVLADPELFVPGARELPRACQRNLPSLPEESFWDRPLNCHTLPVRSLIRALDGFSVVFLVAVLMSSWQEVMLARLDCLAWDRIFLQTLQRQSSDRDSKELCWPRWT